MEEKGVERVENKAINVIGCLDRGQRGERDTETERHRDREKNCLQAF